MYADPYERFVHTPVKRIVPPTPVVPRERVRPEPPPPVPVTLAPPDPVKLFRLAASAGWPGAFVPPEQRLTIRGLACLVAQGSGLSLSDIVGPSRKVDLVKARQLVAWLARRFTDASLPHIGARLGRKDHTTILYAVSRVDDVIQRAGIAAPTSDAPEEWAALLWATDWPGMNGQRPTKVAA